MEEKIAEFIRDAKFPCIMAKSVLRKGLIQIHETYGKSTMDILNLAYDFVEEYRAHKSRLSSFILVLNEKDNMTFEDFENNFWSILKELSIVDHREFPHDPRVSSDPESAEYSFSLKSEAFFILGLHPQSPRFARRFFRPAIVFNPHQQFEDLRSKGIFEKVKRVIRKKDALLQGINPMLADFGEKSEVYQYLGKTYSPDSHGPLEYA